MGDRVTRALQGCEFAQAPLTSPALLSHHAKPPPWERRELNRNNLLSPLSPREGVRGGGREGPGE
jgi:hypothetical protein